MDANVRARRRWLKKKAIILFAYGGECTCCGEDTPEFLALDHTDGGGARDRKARGGGEAFLNSLIADGFPDHIQILCHNCNAAKAYYGGCPHDKS